MAEEKITHTAGGVIMNIYVGQLPYNVGEEDLQELFKPYGEIASLNLIKDKFSGRSKGFAFVDMPNNSEADTAIKALNKSMLKGREIKVNQAEQRRNKQKSRRPRHY
jgi:RNA recognition motif-containing protein